MTSGVSTAVATLAWDASTGPQPLGFGPIAEPMVLDWFGRGAPDLLVTARVGPRGRRTRIYRPLSSPGESPPVYDEGSDLPMLDGLRFPVPIPNGKVSRFDLVALDASGLVLLPNSGQEHGPSFGDRVVLDLPADLGLGPVRISQMLSVDWDGDGLVDLLVGLELLGESWPDPDAPASQQVGTEESGAHPGPGRSGRGRGREPIGALAWLRNVGEPGAPRFAGPEMIDPEGSGPGLATRPAAMLMAWGASRAIEVVATDSGGVVRSFRNFGGQLPPVLMESRVLADEEGTRIRLPDDRTTMIPADVDRDRREELVFGRADGRVFAVHPGKTRDSGRVVGPFLQEGTTLRLGGGSVLTVGDLDGDGGLDLVSGDASGRLHWLMDLGEAGLHRYGPAEPVESGGTPVRLEPVADGRPQGPVEPPLGYACPLLVDWKGNGRPDLIVGGRGGEVLFLRNNGHATQPRFDFAEPIRCERRPLVLLPRVRPAAVDWDGSGLPDLIAPDLQGFLSVWRRIDTLEVAPPEPLVDRLGRLIRGDGAFGLGGHCTLWAGPWIGPDRPDLLIGLPLGSRFVVPAMTGDPLEDLDEVPNILLLENLGEGVVVPRPIRLADGRPLICGDDGCSPIGVDWSGRGSLDLLVGSGAGTVQLYPRELLRW